MFSITVMNRHLKIAILIAPLLALMAYGLNALYYEPQTPPGDYSLTMVGDCQPLTGSCTLKSGSFKINLISLIKNEKKQLLLLPNQALQTLSLALTDQSGQYRDMKMVKLSGGKYWQVDVSELLILDDFTQFRLAMSTGRSQYFREGKISF